MKIGIIQEGKIPQDKRVPLNPRQCATISKNHPEIQLVVAPSPIRCFSNEEYQAAGVQLQENLDDCDILMGVKEVPFEQLLPGKTYFFFSHTIKEQAYNRDLLKAILRLKIRLVDYEVLTNEKGQRLIAFGRFAGMVGAHNALWTYGQRSGSFELPRLYKSKDYASAKKVYPFIQWPAVKIVLTGGGRVANGAAEVLDDMGIKKISPEAFLKESFDEAVYCQLACKDYVARKEDGGFDKKEFYQHPDQYRSIFKPYTEVADIMINGIYWDNRAPAFFAAEEMQSDDFKINVIADVTCDIAPEASIPSTLKPSTITDPVFGYDPHTQEESPAYSPNGIDVMSIDNLPNELPRDASTAFGDQMIEYILPEILHWEKSKVLERATIAENGHLGPHFQYLSDYVK